MHNNKRYPSLNIRSKNELAKHLSTNEKQFASRLKLINDVLENFDDYWYDSDESKPEDGKYVRSAAGSHLGTLLKLIDKRILAPSDRLVPDFFFGGLSGKNHIAAAKHLLGYKRKRMLLAIDIKRFYEQITEDRVANFFQHKCNCSRSAAQLLARLCCVSTGPQGSKSQERILARGFAPSSRLALWCNLETFLMVAWTIRKRLKNKDSRVAIFVDDIGITASGITENDMRKLYEELKIIFETHDKHQPLPLNDKKMKILPYGKMQHLGLALGRNKVSMGSKTRARKDRIVQKLRQGVRGGERSALIKRNKSYHAYQRQINEVNKGR